MNRVCGLARFGVYAVTAMVMAVAHAATAPLRVDDLIAMEGYDGTPRAASVELAPDGSAVVFVKRRAAATLKRIPFGADLPFVRGNTDVWVQEASGATPLNISQ